MYLILISFEENGFYIRRWAFFVVTENKNSICIVGYGEKVSLVLRTAINYFVSYIKLTIQTTLSRTRVVKVIFPAVITAWKYKYSPRKICSYSEYESNLRATERFSAYNIIIFYA